MKWALDDVPMFMAIVDQGGISAAAEALGRPKSTLSTALTRLEQAVGIKLIERTSRRMRLTPEGETFHAQCALIMDQVAEADAIMTGLTAQPSGSLSVALPEAFCQEILAPQLPGFHARHPKIELDLTVNNRPVDLLAEGYDLAIVVGEQPDSTLGQRVLMGGRLIWVTTPDYSLRHGLEDDTEDLPRHIQICEKRYALRQVPVTVNGHHQSLAIPRTAIRLNNPIAVRAAILNGGGVSFLPERYCKSQIATGQLIEIARHIAFDMSAATLSAIFPSRRLMSGRTRVFLDFLTEICRGADMSVPVTGAAVSAHSRPAADRAGFAADR